MRQSPEVVKTWRQVYESFVSVFSVWGWWSSDFADILEKPFTWVSLYSFLFNRCDHCNHAEGSISAWMPPEPCSGSACKCDILIISIYSTAFICWYYYYYGNSIMEAISNLWIFYRRTRSTNDLLGPALTPTPTRVPMRWALSLSSNTPECQFL